MHLPQHQEMLSDAVVYQTLDETIAEIKAANPGAFHVETGENETLSQRVFFHQPVRDIPMKGFVKHVDWATVVAATRGAQRASGTSAASNSSENTNEACELAADAV